jgi:hypothetical protein
MLVTILIVLLILMLIGSPTVSRHNYGWGPSGILGVILVIVLILLLLGRI